MLFCFGLSFDFPTEGSLRKWIYSQAWAKGVCTTVIHLKPSGWGEVWPNSVLGSSISVCRSLLEMCEDTSALGRGFVLASIFCSPKLPETVATQRGARAEGFTGQEVPYGDLESSWQGGGRPFYLRSMVQLIFRSIGQGLGRQLFLLLPWVHVGS